MIDFHVHLAGTGCCGSGIFLGEKFKRRPTFLALRVFEKISTAAMNSDIDDVWVKRIFTLVQESKNVSRVVGLCLDWVHDEKGNCRQDLTQMYIPNSWGQQAALRSDGLMLHGASVHPYRKDVVEELHRVKKAGAFLIKWLPSVMGIDPASDRCDAFYNTLRDLKIPLLSHTNTEYTFGHLGEGWMEKNDVERLRKPLSMGVTVIGAHAGTPTQIDKIEALAKEFPHFYADTSGLFNPTRARSAVRLFEAAQSGVLRERLLYATDWPIPVLPVLLADKLGLSKYREIANISNPFDRDVALKLALGFSVEQFRTNEERLLTRLGRVD